MICIKCDGTGETHIMGQVVLCPVCRGTGVQFETGNTFGYITDSDGYTEATGSDYELRIDQY